MNQVTVYNLEQSNIELRDLLHDHKIAVPGSPEKSQVVNTTIEVHKEVHVSTSHHKVNIKKGIESDDDYSEDNDSDKSAEKKKKKSKKEKKDKKVKKSKSKKKKKKSSSSSSSRSKSSDSARSDLEESLKPQKTGLNTGGNSFFGGAQHHHQ